jgi:hypothetical protein
MRGVGAGFGPPGPGLTPRTLAGSTAGPDFCDACHAPEPGGFQPPGFFSVMSRRRRERKRASARPVARKPAVRRAWLGYAAVFAVAFAVRLAVAMGLSDLPLARMPELDSGQSVSICLPPATIERRFASSNGFWPGPRQTDLCPRCSPRRGAGSGDPSGSHVQPHKT